MRILVCGGRDYRDQSTVDEELDARVMPEWDVIVHGDARGADTLARRYAERFGVPHEPHPADWTKWGDDAGKVRNNEMLAAGVDLVLAFPGGPGTAHMVRMARAVGVPVEEIQP